MQVVPAKIIAKGKRVYFRKKCPTHGHRDDFICSDVAWYDRYDFSLPAKLPKQTFVEPKLGCPKDCGLCSEHEQHTCIGVLEITDNCNLRCPMCYAGSAPGKQHRSLIQSCNAIDALVASEGRADVLQLSGGEPTTHPEFEAILDYALTQPIDYIMINTNGLRLAKDDRLVEKLQKHASRIEVYLQFDGTSDTTYEALRGEPLLETKLRALERIGEAGLHTTLVATIQPNLNDKELGGLLDIAVERPWISGLSLQPATYSGRYYLPEDLENRITFPDCIELICKQTQSDFRPEDFFPLPCAHPNCHILSLAYRHQGKLVPLTRFIDAKTNLDLLANGLSFTREEGQRLVQQYLGRQSCCGPSGCTTDVFTPELVNLQSNSSNIKPNNEPASTAHRFFEQALAKELGAKQLFRITITSFLDAYNFDVRRVMKCCTHHVLPSGHIIPFCAYNVLYRDGHVALPPLSKSAMSPLEKAKLVAQ